MKGIIYIAQQCYIQSLCIYTYVCVCVCVCVYRYCAVQSCFSCVQLFATLWTVAHWAPLSMG